MKNWIELVALVLEGLLVAIGLLFMAAINLFCVAKAIVNPSLPNIVMAFLSLFLWPIVFAVWPTQEESDESDA